MRDTAPLRLFVLRRHPLYIPVIDDQSSKIALMKGMYMPREQIMIAPDERLLTVDDVAARLGVTPGTIARMKALPRVRLSPGTVRFPEHAFNAFLASKMEVTS